MIQKGRQAHSKFDIVHSSVLLFLIYSGRVISGWGDTLYTFNENQFTNQALANYTNAYYNMFSDIGLTSFVGAENDGIIRTAADLKGQGGYSEWFCRRLTHGH